MLVTGSIAIPILDEERQGQETGGEAFALDLALAA
jgi:hypothetical protein